MILDSNLNFSLQILFRTFLTLPV